MSITLDCTTDQGWKTVTAMRHQAKLAGQPFVIHTGPGDEKHATEKQRSALHVWCRQVASVMADAGLDMKTVIRCEIPPTEHMVKENIYKPMLEVLTGKTSTEDQNTIEPSMVAEIITRELGERLGLTLPPFPDRFSQARENS